MYFVGDDLHWIDGEGISHKARVFVAAYKYSGFYYAEAFKNEKVTSWLHGIVNTLEKYGVPRAISFDNARALVSKPDRYIAELRVSMHHLCEHYSLIPNSSKVRQPTHKNVAEYSVGLTERAFANLESFTGAMFARDLKDVNQKQQDEIDIINKTPFKENGKGSRYLSYQNYERPQLKVPPLIPFEICEDEQKQLLTCKLPMPEQIRKRSEALFQQCWAIISNYFDEQLNKEKHGMEESVKEARSARESAFDENEFLRESNEKLKAQILKLQQALDESNKVNEKLELYKRDLEFANKELQCKTEQQEKTLSLMKEIIDKLKS